MFLYVANEWVNLDNVTRIQRIVNRQDPKLFYRLHQGLHNPPLPPLDVGHPDDIKRLEDYLHGQQRKPAEKPADRKG